MNDDLDLRFRRAADAYDIPPGSVESVVGRARSRTGRRRTAAATVLASLLVAVGVTQLVGDGVDETPVAAGGGARSGASGVTWRRADVRSAVNSEITAGGGPVYALSTAAGERDSRTLRRHRVVWRSDDGLDWNSMGVLGDDLFLADLAPRDRRVYAVGTGPATATPRGPRVSELLVGWSDDEGRNWRRSALPLDLAAMAAKATTVTAIQPTIASGPKGTVAMSLVHVELDVPRLLPAGVTAPNGWAVTATGIDVLGPRKADPCPKGSKPSGDPERPARVSAVYCGRDNVATVVTPQDAHGVMASYTFEQLGVTGDLVDAVLRRPFAFAAERDSTEFRRVDAPAVGNVVTMELVAGDGFHLAAVTNDLADSKGGRLLNFSSADGKAWQAESMRGEPGGWISEVGILDGDLAALKSDDQGPSLVRRHGPDGWTSVSLAGVIDPKVLDGRRVHLAAGGIGPMGVVVVVHLENDNAPGTFRLLVSRDGVTWDDQPFDELVGERGAVANRVVVGERQAVVTVGLRPANEGANRRQVALVGSLD